MRALFQNLGVFISYASEHRPIAERIALSLRGRGYKVFLDKDDLPAGASYDDKIHQAILSSGAFIFLISPESIADGRYTLTELKFARERWPNPSRSVLPVVVAKTDLARVPDYLKAVTILEPHGNVAAEVSAAVAKLTKTINRAVFVGVACVAAIIAAALFIFYQLRGSIDVAMTLAPSSEAPGTVPPLATGADATLFRVVYQETHENGVAQIGYRLPYVDLVRKGGPVKGVRYRDTPFQWSFPELSVKLANNTPKNAVLSSAVLKIASSEIAAEPIIIFEDQSMNVIQIANEGWADVIDPVLKFSVKEIKADDEIELFAPQVHTLELKTFASHARPIPINHHVPARLANKDAVAVSGTLEYGARNDRKTLSFETTVLTDIKAGQGLPPSFTYPPTFFEAGKAPATLVVPISQTIKPGEADHFLMTLATDKSSQTRLSVSFKTTTGDILPGGDLLLNYFVPRSKSPGRKP
jgi:hypothetical protein